MKPPVFQKWFVTADRRLFPDRYEASEDSNQEDAPGTGPSKRSVPIRPYLAGVGGGAAGIVLLAMGALALGLIVLAASAAYCAVTIHQEKMIAKGRYEEVPAVCTGKTRTMAERLAFCKTYEFEVDDEEHRSFTLRLDDRIPVSVGKKYLVYFKCPGQYAGQSFVKLIRF